MNKNLGIQILRGHYQLIEEHIASKVTVRQLSKLMRVTMPYSTATLNNGMELPVNRDYAPLGMPKLWYDYEPFSSMAIPAETINEAAAYDTANNNIFLFNDSCPPWRGKAELMAYMKRVQEVFRL